MPQKVIFNKLYENDAFLKLSIKKWSDYFINSNNLTKNSEMLFFELKIFLIFSISKVIYIFQVFYLIKFKLFFTYFILYFSIYSTEFTFIRNKIIIMITYTFKIIFIF